MSAEAVMILLPIVALLLGLGMLFVGYVGSVRTPLSPPQSLAPEDAIDEVASRAARIVLHDEARRSISKRSVENEREDRLLEEISRAT